MKTIFFLLALSASAFAGQSLILSNQTVSNSSIPGVGPGGAFTIDFSVHTWGTITPGDIGSFPAVDLRIFWATSHIMSIYSNHLLGWTGGSCSIDTTGHSLIKVRYQRILSTIPGLAGIDLCQAQAEDGTILADFTTQFSGTSSSTVVNGITLGTGSMSSMAFAYFRMYTTNFAENAQMPATASSQTGAVFQWKFEGDLTDSTGNGYTGTPSSAVTYMATPSQANVFPSAIGGGVCSLSTFPAWTTWVSMNTLATNCLSAAQSYTDLDGTTAITPTWSFISGPATPTIAAPSSVTTNITGATVMGLYTFGLSVTNGTNTATTTLALGAVPMDSTGVVLPTDNRVDQLFGQQIAFGYNPWGYQDERNKKMVDEQIASNPYYTEQALPWLTTGSGTVTYAFSSVGSSPSLIPGGTLNGGITATCGQHGGSCSLIDIHNAQNIPGLASLPTAILIGAGNAARELVRVLSTTSVTGDATLTVQYDGRGIANTPWGSNPTTPAQSWSDGTPVGEMRLYGTGTHFFTDSQRPLAPAGLGPIGPITYATGYAQLTASSGAITGVGTTWSNNFGQVVVATGSTAISVPAFSPWTFDSWYSGQIIYINLVPYTVASATSTTAVLTAPYAGVNNPAANYNYGIAPDDVNTTRTGYMIRVQATHGGGTPFIWWGQIHTINSATSITSYRNAPADVDTGTNFPYQILGPRYLSLEFVSPIWGGLQRDLQQGQYCESETACFATPGHDIPDLDGLQITSAMGAKYSYKNGTGCCSAYGPQFYGTDQAFRKFYERSGYTPALTAANQIGDNWIRDPEVGSGYQPSPLEDGGGFLGAISDILLNPSTPVQWTDLRQWGADGLGYVNSYANSCNNTGGSDLRDQAYTEMYLVQLALHDPDIASRSKWMAGVGVQNSTPFSIQASQPTYPSSTINVFFSPVTITIGQNITAAGGPGAGIPANTTVTSNTTGSSTEVTATGSTLTKLGGNNFLSFVSGTTVAAGVASHLYQVSSNTTTSMVLATAYQFDSGTIDVHNSNAVVNCNNCGNGFPSWISGTALTIGGVAYSVASVDQFSSPQTLTLTVPYAGTTATGVAFAFTTEVSWVYYGNIIGLSNPTTAALNQTYVNLSTNDMLTRDKNCHRADYSYAIPRIATPDTQPSAPTRLYYPVTLTNGSATAVGTSLAYVGTSQGTMCSAVGSGTITVTNGLATATLVTGSLGTQATNLNISITDTTSVPHQVGFYEFNFSGSAVNLAAYWPFASGTFNFVVQSSLQGTGGPPGAGTRGGITAIGSNDYTDVDNIRQTEGWACSNILGHVSVTHNVGSVSWVDGNQFPTFVSGDSVYIGGVAYSVVTNGATSMTITPVYAGTNSGSVSYIYDTQVVLNRPWDDAVTGTGNGAIHPTGTYYITPGGNFGVGPTGYYTQPFMAGINDARISQMALLVPYGLAQSVYNGYNTLLPPTAAWFNTTGYDTNSKGTYYTRVQGTCEPFVTANSTTLFLSIHGAFATAPCDQFSGLLGTESTQIANEFTSRVDSVEAFDMALDYYNTQCLIDSGHCTSAKTFVDTAYGAIWGNPLMTTGGVFADWHYVNTQNEVGDSALAAYKNPGFFFGRGNSSTWPAIRQGKPHVNINWPIQNEIINGATMIMTGQATSNLAAITLVEVEGDGGTYPYYAASGTNPWQFYPIEYLGLPPGVHTLTVRATDAASNQATSSVTVTVAQPTGTCAHTLVAGSSSIYCEEGHFAATGSSTVASTVSVTFPSGHTAGQLLIVDAGYCCVGVPVLGPEIANNLAYTWTFIREGASGYTDGDIVHGGLWYTVVPTTTSSSDVITLSCPPLINQNSIYAVSYTGAGAIDGPGAFLTGWGPYGVTTGPYTVHVGNLNFASVGGAPVSSPPGWNLRVIDTGRGNMLVDQIATSTTAQASWWQNPEGFGGIGVSFFPASTPPSGGIAVGGPTTRSGPQSAK